jgi:hypothetical protein
MCRKWMKRGRSRKRGREGGRLENRNSKLENEKRRGQRPPLFCFDDALLGFEVEAVAGLDLGVLLLHGQVELVVADGGVGLVGGVAEDVLIAEFFVEVRVDFVESLFLGDFKETPAGSFGDLFENLLAVGA